ncbi:hypothetical protein HK105_207448 [Polyrhizophydium stewartii]|uniref:Uncharacterized protein n=1 Tax=Polyrhizophydium stewartii TaxID=2732419 RepID=A0ABR4N0P2_9FUNG
MPDISGIDHPEVAKAKPAASTLPTSFFAQHYIVDVDSLGKPDTPPTYKRFASSGLGSMLNGSTADATGSGHGRIVMPHPVGPLVTRRDARAADVTITVKTASFVITLVCTPPYGEPASSSSSSSSGSPTCDKAANSLKRAAMRLERSLYLPTPITVSTTFRSFCGSTDQAYLGRACPTDDTTLGYAAPAGWHVFTRQAAATFGLDPAFSYPSSLAKQYVPNDPVIAAIAVDVSAAFNSDVNWWFASDADDVGRPDSGAWARFQTVMGGFYGSGGASYDFEQIAMHEICHGLGFISSWFTWIDDSTFLPSFLDRDSAGNVLGLAPAYIYSRWMSDAINTVWLKTYADVISASVVDALAVGGQSGWLSVFQASTGGRVARALGGSDGLFQTPRAIVSWYPDVERNPVATSAAASSSRPYNASITFKFAVIYTPQTYAAGSTLSHLDSAFYARTSDLVMRPSGTSGAGVDAMLTSNPKGCLGEAMLGVFRSMGYVTL